MKKAHVVVGNRSMFDNSNTMCPFTCFGMAPTLTIDLEALDKKYFLLQQTVHPDRIMHLGLVEKSAATARAAVINQAYALLKHPIERLWCYLAACGIAIDRQKNINNEPALMAKVFALQEEMADIETAHDQHHFIENVKAQFDHAQQEFEQAVAQNIPQDMVRVLHWMTYLHKTLQKANLLLSKKVA